MIGQVAGVASVPGRHEQLTIWAGLEGEVNGVHTDRLANFALGLGAADVPCLHRQELMLVEVKVRLDLDQLLEREKVLEQRDSLHFLRHESHRSVKHLEAGHGFTSFGLLVDDHLVVTLELEFERLKELFLRLVKAIVELLVGFLQRRNLVRFSGEEI